MKITKAVITAAAPNQRTLPLQTLVDRDGVPKPLLAILVEEAAQAGAADVCIVVQPGDETAYRDAVGEPAARLHFVAQPQPRGYGHALDCAREFAADEPFLHIVGDHVYVSGNDTCCAQQVAELATAHQCAVSAVQPTRENLLPYFGTVAGPRVQGAMGLYEIERILEKPTPTEAEQSLLVPGLRAGRYLCFFGIHVLTPCLMEILHRHVESAGDDGSVGLSPALAELATRERYIAAEATGRRYPVDGRYGLLTAQIALALSGRDRDRVLAELCELLAQYHDGATSHRETDTAPLEDGS